MDLPESFMGVIIFAISIEDYRKNYVKDQMVSQIFNVHAGLKEQMNIYLN